MDTFRLLHVSDFHFAVRPRMIEFPDTPAALQDLAVTRGRLCPSSHDPDLAEAAARFLYRHPNRFDVVLATGDLATTGHPDDLAVAYEYFFAPPVLAWWGRSGGPTLQAGQAPVRVLPGNHDRYQGWYLGPGGCEFDRTFAPAGWQSGQRAQTLIVLEGERGEKLAIIAADFCLASYYDATGPWGYLGQGKVYPGVLQALREATCRQRQGHGAIGIAWAVHFPPAFADIDPDLMLHDEQLLLDEAAGLGVEHIFCGHTHEARQYTRAGSALVQVHCAGSAAQYVTRCGNALHDTEIDVDAGRVVAVRRRDVWWDQAAGDFV